MIGELTDKEAFRVELHSLIAESLTRRRRRFGNEVEPEPEKELELPEIPDDEISGMHLNIS